MPKYRVHVYREMKLTYNEIEAENPQAAAIIASQKDSLDAGAIDDCEGHTLTALVDIIGDEDFRNSQVFDFYKLVELPEPQPGEL